MNDLTLLYYTANRIVERFQHNVIMRLLQSCPVDARFVTVCQRNTCVLDGYGNQRIVVGEIGASIYNCYRQVLIGAQAAQTRYVALCEDDTLYHDAHFVYRPSTDDSFAYNTNRWVLTQRKNAGGEREAIFYWRKRTQLAMCIAPRDLLIETLEERFRKWPEPISDEEARRCVWGEMGRYEKHMGLTIRKREYFESAEPCVTVNHAQSISGVRRIQATDTVVTELEPWGSSADLWERLRP